MTTTPTPVDLIDLADVLSVEASDRANYWHVAAWTVEGDCHRVTRDMRKDEAESIVETLSDVLLTFGCFTKGTL
jgi:hypothetical protein